MTATSESCPVKNKEKAEVIIDPLIDSLDADGTNKDNKLLSKNDYLFSIPKKRDNSNNDKVINSKTNSETNNRQVRILK